MFSPDVCYDESMTQDKMLGKKNQPFCGSRCCGDTTKRHKRATKRSERQAVRKFLSTF